MDFIADFSTGKNEEFEKRVNGIASGMQTDEGEAVSAEWLPDPEQEYCWTFRWSDSENDPISSDFPAHGYAPDEAFFVYVPETKYLYVCESFI